MCASAAGFWEAREEVVIGTRVCPTMGLLAKRVPLTTEFSGRVNKARVNCLNYTQSLPVIRLFSDHASRNGNPERSEWEPYG